MICRPGVFGFDTSVADRHVKVFNRKGDLIFQPLEPELPTSISEIDQPTAVWSARRDNLLRLPDVLGCALDQLESEQALDMISEVNAIIATEAYRSLNDDGEPGGVIRFPGDMTVVIMGDTHARADNVLRVITEGGMLAALERKQACLVFLGDMVHSQESDELEDMDSSVFILDLFCMLKRRFPENVFYVHGNHESFSADVGKGGVPQGMLFHRYLKKLRGRAYVSEIEKLFDGLAFVVQGDDFAACHGAPVRSKVNLNVLINIRRYPGIQSELVWNRLRQGNRPTGYSKGSVKRFRRTLNLPKHAPLIVGHTPQSDEETLWLNVGGIEGHHIVYSAHMHRLAAMVMSEGQLTPLEFVPEAALAFLKDTVAADSAEKIVLPRFSGSTPVTPFEISCTCVFQQSSKHSAHKHAAERVVKQGSQHTANRQGYYPGHHNAADHTQINCAYSPGHADADNATDRDMCGGYGHSCA